MFFRQRRGELLGAVTPASTGVPSIIPGQRFIGFWDMRRERCEKLQSIKLMSYTISTVGSRAMLSW
jgi:hypothetical protein